MRAFNKLYAMAWPIASPSMHLLYDTRSMSNQADDWYVSNCVYPINFNIVNTKVCEKMKFTKLYKKHPSPIPNSTPSIFHHQSLHHKTHRFHPSPSHSIHLQSTKYSSGAHSPNPSPPTISIPIYPSFFKTSSQNPSPSPISQR